MPFKEQQNEKTLSDSELHWHQCVAEPDTAPILYVQGMEKQNPIKQSI